MMGTSHALSGAVVGVATVPAVMELLHPDISGVGLYVILTTGAALLPDIDHPNSNISRVGGPITRIFAWLLCKLAGGHRNGAHSYWGTGNFALLTTAGAALAMGEPLMMVFGAAAWVLFAMLGFAHGAWDRVRGQENGRLRGRRSTARRRAKKSRPIVTATRGLIYLILLNALVLTCALGGRQAGQWIIGAIMVLVMSAAVRLLKIKGWLDDIAPIPLTLWLLHDRVDLTTVPVAVTVGVLVHIYGDMLTDGGCPLGWPVSQRMISFGLFKTNGPFEERWMGKILSVLLLAAAALVSVYLAP